MRMVADPAPAQTKTQVQTHHCQLRWFLPSCTSQGTDASQKPSAVPLTLAPGVSAAQPSAHFLRRRKCGVIQEIPVLVWTPTW